MPAPSLLAHRDFRLLLLGQTTSQLGAQVSGVAVPLLAVLTLHASPWQLGLVTASSTLAFALVGLPAGAWLDRLRRRPVLVASDLARAALLATIPVAAALGLLSITQLVVVSLLTGFARVFFDVGYQSYTPTVVGRNRLLAGNSSLETVRASGELVGPALGGWLVGVWGASQVVLVQVGTFLVSAASLLAIRTVEPAPAAPATGRVRLRAQVGEGLAFVVRNPVLRATAATSATSNVAFAIASAVTFIFWVRTLGLGPTTVGLLLAAGSVAAMAAAALTPRLSRRLGSARTIWLSLALTGPVNLLTPLAQPGWLAVLAVVGSAVGGAGQLVYAITSASLRQQLCPDELLSRVTASTRFLVMGGFPLGALLGGVLGEVLGLRATLVVSGALLTLAAVPLHLALRGTREVDDLAPWTSGRSLPLSRPPALRRSGVGGGQDRACSPAPRSDRARCSSSARPPVARPHRALTASTGTTATGLASGPCSCPVSTGERTPLSRIDSTA
ncbi:MFS transporter [Auraticoccus cholistanensis]|uniref:MFS transporter n=1 Tax=Auraticoccus cholistanensis TaxID=2656650 RepID=UPI002F9085EB